MKNGLINIEEQIDDYSMASVNEVNGYLMVNFHDDMDDVLSQIQSIKIHPVNFLKFVDMLNEAALFVIGNEL